jgi:predicted RNA-binding Zn-ribbon protein involved in translation (DUF1610 family)
MEPKRAEHQCPACNNKLSDEERGAYKCGGCGATLIRITSARAPAEWESRLQQSGFSLQEDEHGVFYIAAFNHELRFYSNGEWEWEAAMARPGESFEEYLDRLRRINEVRW